IVPEIEKLDDPTAKILKAQEIFTAVVDEYAVQTLLLYRESKALDRDGRIKIMSAEMEHVKIFEDILEDGIQSGAFKPHDTKLMASNIIILGHEWALKGWHLKERFNLEEYIAAQSKFIIDAITP
ncbi:MAG: hypothetical protein JRD68_09665, partial [Deltaproteobacteria bacterium]|nr:hypothetical protein [Deltaproteobacteria bacterium]